MGAATYGCRRHVCLRNADASDESTGHDVRARQLTWAAFCLLLLGTGMNVATLVWLVMSYGWKPTVAWFAALFVIVVGLGYAVDKPLIPPGVEPAGHTHAFDIYTNPFAGTVSLLAIQQVLSDSIHIADRISAVVIALMFVAGWALYLFKVDPDLVTAQKVNSPRVRGKWDRDVSPTVVGATA